MGNNSHIGRDISHAGSDVPLDAAIAARAGRQHGIVTREQLLAVGLNDDGIGYRVELGRLHRVHPGVYSVGKPARTAVERAAAAVLACGPGAALSHGSALALWGFAKVWPRKVHVTVPGDRRRPGITVHRSRTLTPQDIKVQLGIRVTSFARTVLDCSPELGDKRLTRIVNDARREGYIHLESLAETVARSPRHPGAVRLRQFVEDPTNPSRSDFEDEFLPFCERFGLPRPELNTIVAGREVDAYFAAEGVIVELDGWGFHSSRDVFESDRDKDADAAALGLATVRITKQRVRQTPAKEASRLDAILKLRRRAA
ncbi:MAG: hypothetical protein JOZ98_21810 [Solirubrobacterales bacterium]|nr:hypothetical protein [Solirubrobacterales bacterium]MBV9798151.1 hypothetical protein [Solirubrobacterales bacterium]